MYRSFITILIFFTLICCNRQSSSPRAKAENDIKEKVFRYQFEHNNSSQQKNAKVFFLCVDGKDPSPLLLERFADHKPLVKPVSFSKSFASEDVIDKETGERGIIFRMSTIH